jgi:hypothetical protein
LGAGGGALIGSSMGAPSAGALIGGVGGGLAGYLVGNAQCRSAVTAIVVATIDEELAPASASAGGPSVRLRRSVRGFYWPGAARRRRRRGSGVGSHGMVKEL